MQRIKLCYDCFYVSEARYNMEQIAKNLILLQDHLTKEGCADCILKHILTIEALAEEALTLNGYKEWIDLIEDTLNLTAELKEKVVAFLKEGVNLKSGEGFELAQKVRSLRKKIVKRLYNMEEFWGEEEIKEKDNREDMEELGWKCIEKDRWEWSKNKPKTPSEREDVLRRCGAECFLDPSRKAFPICNKYTCCLSCDGLRAAYVRARALISACKKIGALEKAKYYENIANRALQIAKEVGCDWAK